MGPGTPHDECPGTIPIVHAPFAEGKKAGVRREDERAIGLIWRTHLRRIWTIVGLGLVAAACGGGSLSLSEYNVQGTALVTVMEQRIYTLDAEWDSQARTVDRARSYWVRRLEARVEALEGLQALDPPAEIAELHATGLGLFSRLTTAEEALAARVASFENVTDRDLWWDTAEGKAVGAVNDEIDAFCHVFQAAYDATIERIGLSDVPWIPSEMKEVVQIDIGCRQ
jgi:hypothetical protein